MHFRADAILFDAVAVLALTQLGQKGYPEATYDEYVLRGESENRNKETD